MSRALFAKESSGVPIAVLLLLIAFPASGGQSVLPSDATPPDPVQQQIIEAMRQYADDYISKLPDFVCQQTTRQFEAGANGKHWHKDDTLTSKLVFNGGREERTLELINNKHVRPNGARARIPLSTEGEFGLLLNKVFDPASQAKFSWAGWDTMRGRRVARFDYVIDREHSTLSLTNYIKAIIGYHGSVYGDPGTGEIWRATSVSTTIPEELQTKSISTTVDYDQVKIGEQSYLLPVGANILLTTDRDQVRNELEFGSYRKFEAESTITFAQDGGGTIKPDKAPKQQP
ncbi:MAG: hypothetical protein M3Y72_07640 [Acidobacteriota bacterium]|nr:hypothetical protein [Acidobacteriota bacterium]